MLYAPETFTEDEAATLRPYFTNLDGPVFALTNLPEVVKGALFARATRAPTRVCGASSSTSSSAISISPATSRSTRRSGSRRAEELYERVFLEYGDDSVAQLGGVHLACEQASNLLTKILEWGRLMAYLEQSTRYIPYDSRLLGRYRYLRPSQVCQSRLGTRYIADMDALFDTYSAMLPAMMDWAREQHPKQPGDSDFVYKQTIKAKACDTRARVVAGGDALERRDLRHRSGVRSVAASHARASAARSADYAQLMLDELRKVIPSFLVRVDRPERGGAWTRLSRGDARPTRTPSRNACSPRCSRTRTSEVTLLDWDPDGEDKVLAAICYPHSHLPEQQLFDRVRTLPADDRVALMQAYVGERTNRRHKPGRAFERTAYRFDVLGDYGAFRDLQRHRMLTIEWQPLTPYHGYEVPEPVIEAGLEARVRRSDGTFGRVVRRARARSFPDQAAYAVSLGYRMRYVMQMNAREAMHLCELRSSPQGHPTYRRVAQAMHRQIAERAGHRAIAEAMRFVDHGTYDLERLDAERAAEARRVQG